MSDSRPPISGASLPALLRRHRIPERRDDPRRVHVEHRAIRHLGPRKGKRKVEAVIGTARNHVHVVVKHALPRGGATVHDDVHAVRACDLLHHGDNLHRDLEQVHRQRVGNVIEPFEMFPGYDQHMSGIHRLHVHERHNVGVLVAHRDLARAMNEVTERAGGLRSWRHGSSQGECDAWKMHTGCQMSMLQTSRPPWRLSGPRSAVIFLCCRTFLRTRDRFPAWPLKPAPSVRAPPAFRATSSSPRTARCSCRAASTTRRSSSSARTRSSSRSPARDTRLFSRPRAWCSGLPTTGSISIIAIARSACTVSY